MSGATPLHSAPAPAPVADPLISQVLGQLYAIQQSISMQAQLSTQQAQATNARLDDMSRNFEKRLDDMQTHLDGRLNTHEDRIKRVEANERASAIRSATTGGLTGAITSLVAELIKAAMRN